MEIWAAIISVMLAAGIGFVVYSYRAIISYELISIDSGNFNVHEKEIIPKNSWNSFRVTCERITVRNRGLVGIDNATISVERTPLLIEYRVESTKSIPKNSVGVSHNSDALQISFAHLPKGEEVIVELSYVPVGRYNQWRNMRGAGAKFKIRREDTHQFYQRGLGIAYQLLLTGLLLGIFLGRL